MFVSYSVRKAPEVRAALAGACGLVCLMAGPAGAQGSAGGAASAPDQAVAPVVVTASRMPQLLQTAPIGATIITAEQIQRSGVADVNEAIRKLAGVVGKTDLYGGREYALDLRGYGDASSANTVVLVDGVRVSENELLTARLTALPLDQVDRIELVRGGASVLWGEGATAGVINIILKRGEQAQPYAHLQASVERFGGHEVLASGAQRVGTLNVDASIKTVRAQGYRDHADYKQDSTSFGLQWGGSTWSQRFRLQQEVQASKFPGYLSFEQFEQNPRQSTPANAHSQGRQDETRFASHTELQLGELSPQVDVAMRRRRYESNNYARMVDSKQLTPKLAYASRGSEVQTSAVLGLDMQRWQLEVPVDFGPDSGHQLNSAVFAHGSLSLPSGTRVDAGVRRERITKQEVSPYSSYDQRRRLSAAELGVNQMLSQTLAVYGRVARAYRMGNFDENGYTPDGQPLRPQTSRDKELGLRWTVATHALTARVFRQDNVDEIMYAPSPISGVSYNLNADPTRKQGVELEGRWAPAKALELRATWQRLSARYRAGVFDGREQVLVAPQSGTARVSYRFDDHHAMEVGVQYRSDMRFGDDHSNSCARRIPASTLLDARYSWTGQDWTLSLAGSNLADQQGYNYAYRCATGALYPEPGRAFKATVSRRF